MFESTNKMFLKDQVTWNLPTENHCQNFTIWTSLQVCFYEFHTYMYEYFKTRMMLYVIFL